ncbi:MAG TPA: Uma2 family endonuclease [Pseudonocardiaceae bacterium]
MSVMADESGSHPRQHGRPLTVRDLESMPDDGNRYELIDGELYVSAAPATRHQKIVYRLHDVLDAVCPHHLEVIGAPYAVQLSFNTEVQPDLLVAPIEDFTDKKLPAPPLLAVEVLSPSTSVVDLNKKKRLYERFGVPNYWVIDPIEPNLTVFELDDGGRYHLVAEVNGDKPFEAVQPFPARIVLTELLGRFANR